MRRHDEVLRICHQLEAQIVDDFNVVLPDTSVVNFTYHVDGLGPFAQELKATRRSLAPAVWIA